MDPLYIALIVLVVAGVWVLVELAITFRKSRAALDETTRAAINTLDQLQPIVQKIDGALDDVQPALKELPEILSKAEATLDEAHADLSGLNMILADVSDVSGAAAGAAQAASSLANKVSETASGLVSKIKGGSAQKRSLPQDGTHNLHEGAQAASDGSLADSAADLAEPAEPRYVTYASQEEEK